MITNVSLNRGNQDSGFDKDSVAKKRQRQGREGHRLTKSEHKWPSVCQYFECHLRECNVRGNVTTKLVINNFRSNPEILIISEA